MFTIQSVHDVFDVILSSYLSQYYNVIHHKTTMKNITFPVSFGHFAVRLRVLSKK